MTGPTTAHEITIRRVLDAPREAVWAAWTQPEQLAAWWGPAGWSTPPGNVTIDLRAGGTLRITSVSDADGSEMTTVGTFTEVVEPERLAFDEASEDSWHDGATSTATFTDLGDGRTEMVLRSTVHTTDEMIAHARAGMSGSVDRLAELLA
jgi:uncharacterized protein YndB with AHSA1/START domain